jgi:hypothetical protein
MYDQRPLTGVGGRVTCRLEGKGVILNPLEVDLAIKAIQKRLYSMCKAGAPTLKDVMNLSLEAFYPHCQAEAAVLQKAGEKLCRLNLDL